MATLREYFENDFGHNLKVHVRIPFRDDSIEGFILYDFASYSAFLTVYVPGQDKNLEFFVSLIAGINLGSTRVTIDKGITLPPAKEFPGELKVENKEDVQILGRYFGEIEWMSTRNIPASRRIFVYSESNLAGDEIKTLKLRAREVGLEAQFRSEAFVQKRSRMQPPLAFISHDSRDNEIAKKIAVYLQSMLCTVWYDEFSLKIGDNLRESIERGLKECRKCILLLSPHFILNKGWTRIEFDSIFTRQILEKEKLVLPVWYQVSKQEVYDYSPSLLNVYALNWEQQGEDKVCRQLYRAIMND